MITILMGVAGSGKTVVGRALAQRTGLPFYDADDFHPPANVAKMAAGIPLSDEDRAPWLDSLAHHMEAWQEAGGAILACSALRQDYRERLVREVGRQAVRFVYLKADFKTLYARIEQRKGHFFPPGLLQSALDTLEEPDDAFTVDATQGIDHIVNEIVRAERMA